MEWEWHWDSKDSKGQEHLQGKSVEPMEPWDHGPGCLLCIPLSPPHIRPVGCELISCSASPFREAPGGQDSIQQFETLLGFLQWPLEFGPLGNSYEILKLKSDDCVQCCTGHTGIQRLLFSLGARPNPNLSLERRFTFPYHSFTVKQSSTAGAEQGK